MQISFRTFLLFIFAAISHTRSWVCYYENNRYSCVLWAIALGESLFLGHCIEGSFVGVVIMLVVDMCSLLIFATNEKREF